MRSIFAAAILLSTISLVEQAAAQQTIRFAYLQDPAIEAALYAIETGKVTSPDVQVELTGLSLPGLLQATPTKQYDVLTTSLIGIPRARARGLDLTIISSGIRYSQAGEGSDLWVKADSPIKEMADLEGKRIGVFSLGSTGTTLVRAVLEDKYGLDTREGGDVTLIELPPSAMPAALVTGELDAVMLAHSDHYAALNEPDFRSLVMTAKDQLELYGVQFVGAVNAAYQDRLDANPEAYMAFLKLLKDSVAYMHDHSDEVFPAVAAEFNIDAEFLQVWYARFGDFPGVIEPQDMQAYAKTWEIAVELGVMDEPGIGVEKVVWPQALELSGN